MSDFTAKDKGGDDDEVLSLNASLTTLHISAAVSNADNNTLSDKKSTTVLLPDDFRTYDELKNYTIGRLKHVGLCESLVQNHPHDYAYFRALLQGHPDADRKKTALITDIRISRYALVNSRKSDLDVKDYIVSIVTSDGLEDTISWVKSMRKEDYSTEKKLRNAMRVAIDPQIKEFKRINSHRPCAYCGSRTSLTVDHINHFEGLSYAFLQLHPDYPSEYDKDEVTKRYMFREEDSHYEQRWSDYHKSNAQLQILCNDCNSGRPMWQSPIPTPEKRWMPSDGGGEETLPRWSAETAKCPSSSLPRSKRASSRRATHPPHAAKTASIRSRKSPPLPPPPPPGGQDRGLMVDLTN